MSGPAREWVIAAGCIAAGAAVLFIVLMLSHRMR